MLKFIATHLCYTFLKKIIEISDKNVNFPTKLLIKIF